MSEPTPATETRASDCKHDRCAENGHCILNALWLNPPEFSDSTVIGVAARLQERYWQKRREWITDELALVDTLWLLVDLANETQGT